jgi:hypothetical protein
MPYNKPVQQRLATLQQFRDFRDSAIYRDIEAEIYLWLEDIAGQLETVTNYDELMRLQGSARACRNFLNLINIIITQLETEQE